MKQQNKLFSAKSTRMLLLSFLLALLPTAVNAQCPDNNHPHMIDLGLPSGTKWACCNVGATSPDDYGAYYAWGETEAKNSYDWETYLYGHSSEDVDDIGIDISGTDYDVAHVRWGGSWTMPSIEQMRELLDNCQSESAIENDIYGYRITASNGAHVFLPVARKTGRAEYWLSSIFADQPDLGGFLFNYDGNFDIGGYYRYEGYMVRPVTKASSIPSGIAINMDRFPDENFRNWVLAQEYGADGFLTDEEIASITDIEIPQMNIEDLKGIEHFTRALKNPSS